MCSRASALAPELVALLRFQLAVTVSWSMAGLVLLAASQLPPLQVMAVAAAAHQCFALLAVAFMPMVVGAAAAAATTPAPAAAAAAAGAVSVVALYV